MKRTEIPAVKVWSDHDGEPSPKLDYRWMDWKKTEATPLYTKPTDSGREG